MLVFHVFQVSSSDQSGAVGGLLSGHGSSKQSMEHVANGDVTTNDMAKTSTQLERSLLNAD